MSGGIGDFSVTAGKSLGEGTGDAQARASRPAPGPLAEGPIPSDAHSHYIILARREWRQSAPIRFHNGHLDELKSVFRLGARVPLPELRGFFPAGAEGDLILQGKDVLHPGSILRDQPLFAGLESLRALVQRCAERKAAFPEFIAALNKLSIPAAWRNEIVNGLFETAPNAPAYPQAQPKPDQDIDRILGMLEQPGASPRADAPAPNPGLARFLEEVGRDSTGFILRESAARELQKELSEAAAGLRAGLLRHATLTDALAFAASLHRLAKSAKGREKQSVHLWSEIPADPEALLAGDKNGEIRDFTQAVALPDPWGRDEASLLKISSLAARLGAPLLVQLPGEEMTAEASVLARGPAGSQTFFFAGGVAAEAEGGEVVFRPAALAFLEGLVAAREGAGGYRDKAMVLEDQDVLTEKGQGRSTDRLLDNVSAEAVRAKGINRVNGVRNRNVAVFPPLILAESGQ